ncbi:hypothetical protein K1T71_004031 [Dendrolimus kikuchii]|uniref:Uncharacterized protein n=1 Tax=Dendrolimus kikuchii TaxID=765133 RepID=A0ACC1DAL8_9NEOP|nr:hypothetical protein K1T71_004031 [Dendrolimus kikuchii]
MSCKLVTFLFLMCLFHTSYTQRNLKFFRNDYHYINDLKSFYKIHTIAKTWEDAKKTCKLEGAFLFYPVTEVEANAVMDYWNATQAFSWIFIGISSRFAKESFITIEGKPIIDVYHKWALGQPNDAGGVQDCVVFHKGDGCLNDENCNKKLPFICKKTLVSLEWNDRCNIADPGYVYTLSKCYKIHRTLMTWSEAYAVCYKEQSYLAIVNNQAEADYFAALMDEVSIDNRLQYNSTRVIYLGFQNINGEEWTTIRDTPLTDAGYNRWGDRLLNEDTGCGSMSRDGTLNGIKCNEKHVFICERESINNLDERLGEILNS